MREGARARRASSTRRRQSVQDIDAVRQALGAPKLELMGVSYGTYVAAQYARQFPASDRRADPRLGRRPRRDRRLLPGHLRAPAARARRAVRAARAAWARPRDPVADLGTLARRLARQGALRGTRPGHPRRAARDRRARRVRAAVDHHVGRPEPVPAGRAAGRDQRRRPRRRRAAAAPAPRSRRGRSRRPASSASTLNVATTCADVTLPYTLADDRVGLRWDSVAARRPTLRARQRVRAVQPPGGRSTRRSPTTACAGRRATRSPRRRPRRCPTSRRCCSAAGSTRARRSRTRRELLPLLPHGQLLTVAGHRPRRPGLRHHRLRGQGAEALWPTGRQIGTPCRGKRQRGARCWRGRPRSIADYRRPASVAGDRGSGAVRDARHGHRRAGQRAADALRRLHAGSRAAGCAPGASRRRATAARLRLHGYSLVPGAAGQRRAARRRRPATRGP